MGSGSGHQVRMMSNWCSWGAEKVTCKSIYAFVAKRLFGNYALFCRETRYVKFTRMFRFLRNIVYHLQPIEIFLKVMVTLYTS